MLHYPIIVEGCTQGGGSFAARVEIEFSPTLDRYTGLQAGTEAVCGSWCGTRVVHCHVGGLLCTSYAVDVATLLACQLDD